MATKLSRGQPYGRADRDYTPPKNRYNRAFGQLAQLVSRPLIWAARRDWAILRAIWLALFAAALWANWFGHAITLLVIGQFGRSIKRGLPED